MHAHLCDLIVIAPGERWRRHSFPARQPRRVVYDNFATHVSQKRINAIHVLHPQ